MMARPHAVFHFGVSHIPVLSDLYQVNVAKKPGTGRRITAGILGLDLCRCDKWERVGRRFNDEVGNFRNVRKSMRCCSFC